MNAWFLNHPTEKNQRYPWVGLTTTSALIMSMFFVLRHASFCDGFRIASVGTRNKLRRISTTRRAGSSFLESHHSSAATAPCWRRQKLYAATSKALFSTAGDKVQESTKDLSESLLYQQFKELSQEIKKHDELYYTSNNSTTTSMLLSDDEFDALVRKEEELEQEHPEFLQAWQEESGLGKAATRSGRVGSQATKEEERLKRRHHKPMLSLDNVHNQDQLLVWLKRVVKAAEAKENEVSSSSMVTIVTEPKLDGVSLSLRYETSADNESTSSDNIPLELQWASTRGDGTIGQDVTAAAKQMTRIPDTIYLPKETVGDRQDIVIEVRGEVVMPRSEFLKIQQEAREASEQKQEESNDEQNSTKASKSATDPAIVSFANPRNAASGILLRKESNDPEEQASNAKLRSLLRFYAYDLSGLEKEGSELDGIQIREQLAEWDFPLALPVAFTNLEWKHSDKEESTSQAESSAESNALWDDWFQNTIASNQISPILEYFSALEEHRERLQEEDNKNVVNSTDRKKSKISKSSGKYDWGDFDMDGCVHKVTQASIRSAMGYTTKSPKWATAHKFPAQSSVARLLDVIVQVGRTGAITPVAVLEPTEVGGVTIQRATLHNFGHLQEIMGFEDVSKAGVAKIPKYEPLLVQRAGDVIPQVVRRIKSQSEQEDSSATEWISLDPPEKCPFCSSPVTYDTLAQSSSSSAVGQVVRCSGPPLLCPPRAVTSLKHAFSRDALDLTGLSEARIQNLMDLGVLKFPSDMFTMRDDQWETVEGLPKWGTKSVRNLRDASEKVASKGISLGRFIYSLGIRHVGKHTSELIASCYGSVGAFWEAIDAASQHNQAESNVEAVGEEIQEGKNTVSISHHFPELENKLGIGPVAIDSLIAFSKTEELVDAAKTLAEALNIEEQAVVLEDLEDDSSATSLDSTPESGDTQPWKGFRVVFTGSLGIVDGLTRSKAQEIAKQLGAKSTPGSVSKSTDLVVFGDKGGKKLTQARELGIATMEAEEFVKLANENGLLDVDDR